MIDSHCHIFEKEFNNDQESVIFRAKENKVNKIILVGFSKKTNEQAYNLALKYPQYLYPTAGLHPSEVDENYLDKINELEKFINEHKVYAIGECGLDFHYDTTYKEEQIKAFRCQIELGIKYNLPIIVHSRDAILETYNTIKEYPSCYGVMHCYSGSVEMAKLFLKLNFHISLGGPVTFKNARVPKEVAEFVPLDRMLIETDSPYLAPMPNRGKRNEPSYLQYIMEEISKIKKINIIELDKILEANTIKLFRLE